MHCKELLSAFILIFMHATYTYTSTYKHTGKHMHVYTHKHTLILAKHIPTQ